MSTFTRYHIGYLGIGGIDVAERFTGDREGLAEHITMIEESGGQQVVAHPVDDENNPIYECGGFVITTDNKKAS